MFLVAIIIFMVGFALLGGFLGYYSPNGGSSTPLVRVFRFTAESSPFPAGRNTSFVLGGYVFSVYNTGTFYCGEHQNGTTWCNTGGYISFTVAAHGSSEGVRFSYIGSPPWCTNCLGPLKASLYGGAVTFTWSLARGRASALTVTVDTGSTQLPTTNITQLIYEGSNLTPYDVNSAPQGCDAVCAIMRDTQFVQAENGSHYVYSGLFGASSCDEENCTNYVVYEFSLYPSPNITIYPCGENNFKAVYIEGEIQVSVNTQGWIVYIWRLPTSEVNIYMCPEISVGN